MTTAFPHSMDFAGYNQPSRIECDVYDLVVDGEIPKEIAGSWYRSIPDPPYPPLLGHDTYLSGDGMVSLLRVENGHADFKMRYVQTERYRAQKEARRGLFGLYRNPYTDDLSVRGKGRGAANTTPVFHGGRLLALKEDSRGWELDPHTLETKGEWSYDGKLRSQTMTAHTRLDPDTGELYFFGYEASGIASRDVAYCKADRNGQLVREDWFEVPYCALMHDFCVTKEHAIFPVFPTVADYDRIKSGGPHWVYEPDRESYVGIMPRDGSVKEMRWFKYPARSAFHFMNAYSEGDKVHMDFGVSNVNPFPFIMEASGLKPDPTKMRGGLVRWTFDLSRPDSEIEETVIGPPGDMPRVADKDHMKDYEIGYYQRFDPEVGPPLVAGPVGAGFNTINRINVKTRKLHTLRMDNRTTVQEHVHIASRHKDHEGYLMFVADIHDEPYSQIWILEAERPEAGPVAKLHLPLRLRVGVHGNWVNAEAF